MASVVGVGDLDGDGCNEVVVAIPARDAVRIFFGAPMNPLVRQFVLTGMAGEQLGAAVL